MIDSEIFGQNQDLEKPPRGKPVRERESFYYASGSKSDINFYSKKSNLSQPRNLTSRLSWFPSFCCLDFCANLLGKCAKNISKFQPLKTVPNYSESVLYGQQLMLLYGSSNSVPELNVAASRCVLYLPSKTVPNPYYTKLLENCACNKCRPYLLDFCANK